VQCPYCSADSNVVDSRSLGDGVRRRRICGQCKRRFTTYERAAPPNVKVIKRSGKLEPFDAAKIRAVLARVGSGRPAIDEAAIKRLAARIEAQLVDDRVKTVPSSTIALRLLARLEDIDKLAYERLAADYLDESGQLRVVGPTTMDDDQLGLFEEES
jgi:transcriptional repressor NrdR